MTRIVLCTWHIVKYSSHIWHGVYHDNMYNASPKQHFRIEFRGVFEVDNLKEEVISPGWSIHSEPNFVQVLNVMFTLVLFQWLDRPARLSAWRTLGLVVQENVSSVRDSFVKFGEKNCQACRLQHCSSCNHQLRKREKNGRERKVERERGRLRSKERRSERERKKERKREGAKRETEDVS